MRPSVKQPIWKDKNVMARTRKYYLKKHYLTLRSKVKVPQRSLRYATNRLMVMPSHTKYHWPISKDKMLWPGQENTFKKQSFDLEVKGQGPTKVITACDTPPYGHAPTYQISTYLERNNYLTLKSKVKVQRRSLWYAKHRLIVMHPHTKYHWPISKDTNVMARTWKYYLKKQLFIWPWGQSPTKVITVCDTPPYGHAPTHQI
jgi:hypothetical protein